MNRPTPTYGDIWLVDFGNPVGHEQGFQRPAIVVSRDDFNAGPTELVVVVPATTKQRNTPLHVVVTPPEGGFRQVSYIKCEDVRSISQDRLISRWGQVTPATLLAVSLRLRHLMRL